MLWRIREALMRFMRGRYGADALGSALFAVYFLLWLISLFVRQPVASLILYTLSALLLVVLFARALSRNIPRRQAENARFLRVWTPIRLWLRRQFDRLRYIRRWRFRRCPYCHAELRLPIRRGRRTVTCFRCNGQFKAFFL